MVWVRFMGLFSICVELDPWPRKAWFYLLYIGALKPNILYPKKALNNDKQQYYICRTAYEMRGAQSNPKTTTFTTLLSTMILWSRL